MGRSVIETDPDRDKSVYIKLGRIYRDAGRAREGIPYFERLRAEHPDVPEIRAALGSLLLKDGKMADAETELLEALKMDPALSDPLAELHTLYKNTPRILTLEPIVRKGLELDDKSLVHLNWLGLIYEWKRDVPQAEKTFKYEGYDIITLQKEIERDYVIPEPQTAQEIIGYYSRRIAQEVKLPSQFAALAPIRALETARDKGVRTTTLFNALALSYLQEHQYEKAVQFLNESLTIEPNQKDVDDLLQKVRRRSR